MPLHYVKIIESGHMSTQRLFELGLSFGVCKRKCHWPSLETINSFLKQSTDDGKLGTTIEWPSCELTLQEYQQAVVAFMAGKQFKMDTEISDWEGWIEKVSSEPDAV
jgi:hypothetical protein